MLHRWTRVQGSSTTSTDPKDEQVVARKRARNVKSGRGRRGPRRERGAVLQLDQRKAGRGHLRPCPTGHAKDGTGFCSRKPLQTSKMGAGRDDSQLLKLLPMGCS